MGLNIAAFVKQRFSVTRLSDGRHFPSALPAKLPCVPAPRPCSNTQSKSNFSVSNLATSSGGKKRRRNSTSFVLLS